MTFLFVAIGIALVFGVIGISIYLDARRRAALRRVADNLGMSYEARSAADYELQLKSLPLMTLGHRHRCDNVLRGVYEGGPALLFDYTYTIGSGKHANKHRQTVACFLPEGVAFPAIIVRPEGLGDRLAGVFGYQDLDFTDAPEFSKAFWVKGADEVSARTVLDPATRGYLMERPTWSLQVDGSRILIFQQGKALKPVDWAGFYQEACGLLDHMLALPSEA